MACLGCPREQSGRFQGILVGELAVGQDVAQAVHRLEMVLGGSRPQQAQAPLLVDARAAALEQRDGQCRCGAHIASVRSLPIPAHGLDLVSDAGDAGCMHPAQAVHDVRVAAVGQPAQHLQEVALIGRNPPHLELDLAARRHRRHALAQLIHVRNGPAVQADNDIAKADADLGGWTAGEGI